MNDIAIQEVDTITASLTISEQVNLLEAEMLQLPQVECPVRNIFSPGLWIREVTIPAGTFSIGHEQKMVHWNVLLKGRVTIVLEDGSKAELVAPLTYVGRPGRKVGYVHEDMVWQNVYPTDETDIEKLEAMFINKSHAWDNKQETQDNLLSLVNYVDNEDYHALLREYGITESEARQQSENTDDQIPLPYGAYKISVSDSAIEGKGLFSTAPIEAGEVIAPARINGKRTIAGRYTNHSPVPNAKMIMNDMGDIYLVAIKAIDGCKGGSLGEEITTNYRDTEKLHSKEIKE